MKMAMAMMLMSPEKLKGPLSSHLSAGEAKTF